MLSDNVHEKSLEVNNLQSTLDDIHSDNSSIISALESSQSDYSSIGENIARMESTYQSLEKSIAQTQDEIEEANSNYLKALEKEQDEEKLTPKEKAIH